MTQSWADIAGAALVSVLGLATLPQLALLAATGLLLGPRVRNPAAFLLAPGLLYALIAARDAGHAWPQLDALTAAISHPLPWFAAALLAAGLWASRPERAALRVIFLPLALLAVAALARPSHDPLALAQLRGALGESSRDGAIFLFHFIQGLVLTAGLMAGASVTGRWLRGRDALLSRLALGGRALLVLWAASFVTGAYGGLCRLWLLRWPPGEF